MKQLLDNARVTKNWNIPHHPSAFIPNYFNTGLFPPPTTNPLIPMSPLQTVSLSQPLSSTPSSLPTHHIASSPPRRPSPLNRPPFHLHQHPTALREACQSQAYKRGFDVGLGGQPAPLCSPAQWRMKLAGGASSMAVGHSRQPGSCAWPTLQPQHHHHRMPTKCTHHITPDPRLLFW